jgi:thiol-disulfide isomerase/thioredoxin
MKFKFLITLSLLLLILFIANNTLAQSDEIPQVKIINVEDLQDLTNHDTGLPLFINVWATWCAPCREEFPELVKLADTYKNEIRVVGISVDDSEIVDSKVIPFLEDQKAEFINYLLKVIDPEDFINLLNEEWSGAIPATFIYDKNGNQKEMLIGKQTYQQFEETVKKVID